MNEILKEQGLHTIFRASLIIKGAFSFFEIVGGILAYFVSQQFLFDIAATVTHSELTEDPSDFLGNYLLHLAQNYSLDAQHFTALYLLSHGIVKLFLVHGLYKERLWYYPASLLVFTLFIVYQLFRFTTTHSVWLLVLTVLDIAIIALTWHEYRYLKKLLTPPVLPAA